MRVHCPREGLRPAEPPQCEWRRHWFSVCGVRICGSAGRTPSRGALVFGRFAGFACALQFRGDTAVEGNRTSSTSRPETSFVRSSSGKPCLSFALVQLAATMRFGLWPKESEALKRRASYRFATFRFHASARGGQRQRARRIGISLRPPPQASGAIDLQGRTGSRATRRIARSTRARHSWLHATWRGHCSIALRLSGPCRGERPAAT